MVASLDPQEIYLLERYSSVEYFGEMRDAWAAMVAHAERCLDAFVNDLPSNYRKRQLPEQPDIVWGERVLVNFRYTRDNLVAEFIKLTHGDMNALSWANGVHNDFAGFSRDYSSEWMDEPNVAKVIPNGSEEFWRLLREASERASNIAPTFHTHWTVGALTSRYGSSRGPLNAPTEWPTYHLKPGVRVETGKPISRSGVYLPAATDSCAALLIEGQEAYPANIGADKWGHAISEQATTWTLIERVSDTGGGKPGSADPIEAGVRLRCEAGQPCPREGYWFTPARINSRRHFNAGEVMPDVGGDYGSTIWQWDASQKSS
jgi:hypothetical protein